MAPGLGAPPAPRGSLTACRECMQESLGWSLSLAGNKSSRCRPLVLELAVNARRPVCPSSCAACSLSPAHGCSCLGSRRSAVSPSAVPQAGGDATGLQEHPPHLPSEARGPGVSLAPAGLRAALASGLGRGGWLGARQPAPFFPVSVFFSGFKV